MTLFIPSCHLLVGLSQRLNYHCGPFAGISPSKLWLEEIRHLQTAGVNLSTAVGGNALWLPLPSGLLHLLLHQKLPLTHPAPSHCSTNQQICNLSAMMNSGRLQPWLPPQAQMDDSGPLKCFLCHSVWHSQGEQQKAMFLCSNRVLCFVFFVNVWAECQWQETQSVTAPSQTFTQLGSNSYSFTSFLLLTCITTIDFLRQNIFEILMTCVQYFSSPVTCNCGHDVSNCSTSCHCPYNSFLCGTMSGNCIPNCRANWEVFRINYKPFSQMMKKNWFNYTHF